jgi:uncharacterized protein
VLGDLEHGAAQADAPWIADVKAWRQMHAELDMVLVGGNHDRHFDASTLGFRIVDAPWQLPPFAMCHTPTRIGDQYVLAGHVHPGITVRDGWRRHRVPAFRLGEHTAVLPAFGSLTGLHETPQQAGERVIAATPAGLLVISDG